MPKSERQIADALFPQDWRGQVRELLTPFEKEPTCKEERLGRWRRYEFQEVDLTKTVHEGNWGAFLMGKYLMEYLATPGYGGEEEQWIVCADKRQLTPLHFWAVAIGVMVFIYSGELLLDYQMEPMSRLIDLATSQTVKEAMKNYPWPSCARPLPSMVEEIVIRCWQLRGEWNDVYFLFETADSFCLWNWNTSA